MAYFAYFLHCLFVEEIGRHYVKVISADEVILFETLCIVLTMYSL